MTLTVSAYEPLNDQLLDEYAHEGASTRKAAQETSKDSKQSSLSTIFSIWNTMMGSSLLAIPWGFSQSGIVGGFLTCFCVGLICYYTCSLIVRHGTGYADFFELCYAYLGRWGRLLCWSSSLLVLLGALFAYDRLMSDCLYYAVNGFRSMGSDADIGETSFWSLKLSPIVVLLMMLPISSLKDFSVLSKINTFGIVAVVYVIGFVFSTSVFDQQIESSRLPPLFEGHFTKFAGILTLSFFIHNCILPILKLQRNPENNNRDLGIAFVLVGLSYALLGALAYMAYTAGSIPENFLNNYSTTQASAIIARLAVLIQLSSVFPLICCIIRGQFFGFLYQTEYPSFWHILALNLFLCGSSTLVSIFYPHIGDILRFTGAACGLIYVFILPIGVHLRKTYFTDPHTIVDNRGPTLTQALLDHDATDLDSALYEHDEESLHPRATGTVQNGLATTEVGLGPDGRYDRGYSFWLSILFHGALTSLGVASLVCQFAL